MLAKAAVNDDMPTIIRSGMKQIPKKSRLYEELAEILSRFESGDTAEETKAYILGKYDENNQHHWCHTVSNAAIVAMGLLWGKKDFTYTMELCLTMGFVTDCNCATAGLCAWYGTGCTAFAGGLDGAAQRPCAFRRGRLRTRAYFGHGSAYTGARRVKNNKFFAGTRLFGGVSAFYTENPRAVHNFFGIFGYSKGLRYDIL